MKLRWAGWLLGFYLLTSLTFAAFVFVNYFAQSATNGSTHKQHNNHKTAEVRGQWTYQSLLNEKGDIDIGGVKDSVQKPNLSVESDAEKKYWDQWAPTNLHSRNKSFSHYVKPRISGVADHIVDIWSNNGLGDYLWLHLLHGELKLRPDNLYRHGEKTINTIKYRYRSDSSLSVAYLPRTSANVVLVLNGRSNNTVQTAISWLDQLVELDMLQNVGLMLIGDETCSNGWLLSYLHHKNSSSPKFVFLVYDSPEVDNKFIHQFPLGVATYRNFPLASFPDLVTVGERRYICNFMGTVYPNSSREHLVKVVKSLPSHYQQRCYMSARAVWLPSETADSLDSYVKVLKSSDLTLCPVGMNAESYRIYEAMSVGSVPVIEDVVVNRTCAQAAHRLLKEYGAPVMYVRDWSQLPDILAREQGLTLRFKERRREKVIEWYKQFRTKMAEKFTYFVETKFFDIR